MGEYELVGEVCMIGLMGVFEFVLDKKNLVKLFLDVGFFGMLCWDVFFENGMVMCVVCDSMIILLLLVFIYEEVDYLVVMVEKMLNDIY